jgi:hypothetical protein
MAKAKGISLVDMVKFLRSRRDMPATSEPALRVIGRSNARYHVSGAYSHLFTDADVQRFPLSARSLWKAMHDTGDLRMVVGDGEAEVEITGYGYPSPEMCEMIQPYLEELFASAGLKQPHIEKRACCRAGGAACRYYVRWPDDTTAG